MLRRARSIGPGQLRRWFALAPAALAVVLVAGAARAADPSLAPDVATAANANAVHVAGIAGLDRDRKADVSGLSPLRGRDAVFSTRGRVTMLAADGNWATVATSVKRGCGRIVAWRAPGRTSRGVMPGILGCHGDGISELAVGAGRVAWIEQGGGNDLEMNVMAAKLGGGAVKHLDYEVNGDRAGGDPTGGWVGQLLGGGSLLAYNNWTQVCDRPADSECGENDPLLRLTGEKLVRIAAGRRVVVTRGPEAYPLTAIGGGRMAVRRAGAVTIRSATGAPLAIVRDIDSRARAVALSRTQLAIERTTTVELYDPTTGAAVRSLPLGPAAALELADVTSRLALLRGSRRLVLLRLTDGKPISLRLRPGATSTLVGARLTAAGLFYAYNTGTGSARGRIVFEPTRALLTRF
jgi:hypothetical protein